ncbi:MAG: ATP-dependent DNA helicase DinG [Treponema sp.]|jgi:ATP-dependent DNA helicase DinG|nr:ATP-dependent DNA helicase DinG [Treponema sp.]
MAEAGTGVGKSFAYLLPAMHFALLTKEKVVISTATITLQQQLFEKDIPLVVSSMGAQIKSVIMKGRGNYLCLRRLDDSIIEPVLDGQEYEEIRLISEWAQTTKTGGRTELSFMPSETVWSSICSESDLCLGKHCPFQERCFVLALRKEANNASIIVVNHHLLFADLAARFHGAGGYENAVVLPPFARLIIDEAHTIENAATSFFSAEFGRTGIFRQLSRLYHKRRASKRGLLVRLCTMLPSSEDPLDVPASALLKIRKSVEELDECALQLCGADGIFRLSPSVDEDFLKESLFPHFKALRRDILAFTDMIHKITESLEEETADNPLVWEIKTIMKRLEGTAEICGVFCKYKRHEDEILWIERQRIEERFKNEQWAVFTRTPLDLAPKLKDSVFSPKKTVVCVSATLAINGDFSWWAGRCGIGSVENRAVLSGCFLSPFPYSNAVLLASPTDTPLPDEEGWQDFIGKAACRLAAAAGGSALVLFTSYQSLTSAHQTAKNELVPLGIRCLKQGEDDRSRLLQDFVSDTNSCLFATDSFWEGIDAPGDTLRLVIICRLPFRTPGDPVFEARREAVQKRGGNPFMELSLPHAVMKFKQGFGRLMRKNNDRGVVVVLDGRLLRKSYGQIFLQSLPETRTSFRELDRILIDIENFLY